MPTVNGDLISINEYPKLFEHEFPSEFKGIEFSDLLIFLDPDSRQLVSELAKFIKYSQLNYTEKELANKINSLTESIDVKTRVKIFIWWNENYPNCKSIPNLVQDTNEKWIEFNSSVYLPTETGISELPKELAWVKLCIVKQEYVTELISQIKKENTKKWDELIDSYTSHADKRILSAYSDKYWAIKFIEQSSSNLIISSINQQIDSFEKSKSFINWFYAKYKNSLNAGSELSKIAFMLPDRNHIIRQITELYLGEDYKNPIAEKLFQNTQISPLATITDIYNGTEKDEFVVFLEKCGILKYPKISSKSLLDQDNFKKYVASNYVRDININYLSSKTIDNFENLIKSLSTEEIVKWFTNDEALRGLLISQEKESSAKQQINWGPQNFASNAYIKFILNSTSWIEFEGKKYAPSKIIKYDKIKNKIDGYYGVSEQNLIQKIGKDFVLLFQLDFKESFASLPDNDIKRILTSLPSFDKGEISRKLYLDIIKYKKELKPSYSTDDIQVLAKDSKFYPNTDVKYADRRIPKSITEKSHFIYIQPKQSIETIHEWLGVERYKTNIKLKNHKIHSVKKEFLAEMDEIKTAVLCTIDNNERNVNNLKRLKIYPCSKIDALDVERNNETIVVEDYFFVEDTNCFYVKLPDEISIEKLRLVDDFSTMIVDIFKQMLTLELDSDFIELLIQKDRDNKKKKIEDKYGVDQWNISYELLNNMNYTNEQFYKFFCDNHLEQSISSEIIKIDFSCELNEKETELLIQALKNIKKDIEDLNQVSELQTFDIRPYYEKKLKKLLEVKYDVYKQSLYTNSTTPAQRSHFLEKLDEFKNYSTSNFEIENSVYYDFEKKIFAKFPLLQNGNFANKDIDVIYNYNVKKVKDENKIQQSDFDFFIQSHRDINSILYFEIPSDISEKIKTFLDTRNSDNNDVNKSISNTRTTSTKLLPKSSVLENVERSKKEKSQKDYERQNRNNEVIGEKAEKIAYEELKKKYQNLIWHSKYSPNPSDRNNIPPNGIVCDMWNRDVEKGNIYFEVKSATTEFEMSIHEYKSMERNKNNYEVVLVNHETGEISRHKYEEICNLKEVNEYKFRFIQKKLP